MRIESRQSDRLHDIPRGIWVLGFVSMLMDVSSEIIHALLPLYLVTVLGTPTLTVGIIEGAAEATASITRVFSGVLSDRLGRRKLPAAIGYGLAAVTKPVFGLAPSVGWLIAARLIDRLGKGIRGAPRDALVADIAPVHLRGASFGLRQSLDTAGAFLGPVLAVGFMWATGNNFRTVFLAAVAPAFASFALIVFAVHEPQRAGRERRTSSPLHASALRRLPSHYWAITGIAAVFTLARFSEAFLLLRAQSAGLPVMLAPIVMIVMNAVYMASAYPAGLMSDRKDRITVLMTGFAVLICADVLLALSSGVPGVMLGVMLWGLHMGFTQGILATLIADTAPPDLRGTAYGMFNLVGGIAILAGSVIAGSFWDLWGPKATFLAGGAFAAAALVGLMFFRHPLDVSQAALPGADG